MNQPPETPEPGWQPWLREKSQTPNLTLGVLTVVMVGWHSDMERLAQSLGAQWDLATTTLRWPHGTIARFYTVAAPQRMRGYQHDAMYVAAGVHDATGGQEALRLMRASMKEHHTPTVGRGWSSPHDTTKRP